MNNKTKQRYKVIYSPLVVLLIAILLPIITGILVEPFANLFRAMNGLSDGEIPDFMPQSSIVFLYTYPVVLLFFIAYTITWFFIKYNNKLVRIIFWTYISFVVLVNLSIGITAFNEVYNTPPGGYFTQGLTF
jgi:cation transporter-like permease